MDSAIRLQMDRVQLEIRDDVLRLSHMVERAIEQAIFAFEKRDAVQAQQIINDDSDINALRYRIEQKSYNLLATQQPTARDMRSIITAIHVVVELERIADYAAGIAKITRDLTHETSIPTPPDIPFMGKIALEMLRSSLECYLNWDARQAQRIVERDNTVDELDKKVYRELLQCMIQDPQRVNSGTFLLWITHNVERIADHVTNICERVIFMVTGEILVEEQG